MSESIHSYQVPLLHINGHWRAGSASTTSRIVNPATGEVLGDLGHASSKDLEDVLCAVSSGFEVWRASASSERQRILYQAVQNIRTRVEEIAPLITLEQGKPISQSRAEVQAAASMIQWYAEQARRIYGRIIDGASTDIDIEVRKQPIGPCLLLSPWNMPVLLAARKIGGALAAGCACIIKPPEETPAGIAAIVRCFLDAGVPDGVINLVFGVPSEVSAKLIGSDVIRKISFTGSVAVGQHLASLAAPGLKRLTLELGGHSPVIVMPDANLEITVEQLVLAKFRNAGQICLAPTRFFVHEHIYAEFLDRFVARVERLKLGNGLDESTEMGPLANGRRVQAMADLVTANADSSKVVTGGKVIGEGGFFFAPTVLAEATDQTPAMSMEPFGPVALMTRFKTIDEAISRSNANRYGLASYVFTDSAKAQKRLLDGLDVGSVAVNSTVASLAEAPFGGVKDSGYGYESGEEGLEGYLHTKTVHRAYR